MLDGTALSSRILVVDDNQQNLDLVEAILAGSGFKNMVFLSDSRKVIAEVEAQRPDAILLDIRMPHLDGHQILGMLADYYQDSYIPAIVLTAHADRATCRKVLSNGARDFLAKPLDPDELVLRLGNMLETWHLYHFRRRHSEILADLVEVKTAELRQAHMDIILRLGRAGEYRDSDTGHHVVRMSRCCYLLAQKIGCDEEWADLLLHASPLHDVGKIGIPDQILLKPASLTNEERDVIKRHVGIGIDILSGGSNPLIEMARVISATHHERWDGAGYQQGLSGEDIPLEGRIAAICDVFDALVSPRPYKRAWPVEDALSLLRSEAGKAFDPHLVEVFLQNSDEFVSIIREFADIASDADGSV